MIQKLGDVIADSLNQSWITNISNWYFIYIEIQNVIIKSVLDSEVASTQEVIY